MHMEPFNSEYLETYSNGDAGWERDFAKVFVAQVEDKLPALRHAIQSEESAMWRDTAHFLKGCAGNMGAPAMSALCEKAQSQAGSDRFTKQELLIRIENSYEEVKAILRKKYAL